MQEEKIEVIMSIKEYKRLKDIEAKYSQHLEMMRKRYQRYSENRKLKKTLETQEVEYILENTN